ncbi:coenzyme F420 hydrogenase/dehydrogenase beta subunit N-terminal domain-containing protein, partial [Candidatus Omnitrophota bacterium]
MAEKLFQESDYDSEVGYYQVAYAGWMSDMRLRKEASSAGFVTGILQFLFDAGEIEGAVVTRAKPEYPMQSEVYIARTKDELEASKGSKYCPTPTGAAFKEIRESAGRYAFVGLPCHIHGLRKAQQELTFLKEKIVISISLFCGGLTTFRGGDFVLDKFKIAKNDIQSFQYRGGGLPDGIKVRFKSQAQDVFIPSKSYYS